MSPEQKQKPLYNSRILEAFIQFVRSSYPQVDLPQLLERARIQPYEIEDEGHWFTQQQVNSFYRLLEEATGNRNLAREVGRSAASGKSMGVMRYYLLSLAGPERAFARLGKASRHFTRSTVYESRQLQSRKIEVTVTPRPGTKERPFQCQNRMGYFESILTLFNRQSPQISHPECCFKGGSCCRYLISWQPSRSARWRRWRNAAVGAVALTGIALAPLAPLLALAISLPVALATILAFNLITQTIDRSELQQNLTALQQSTEGLANQIDSNYRKSRITEEIGRILGKRAATSIQLQQVINTLVRQLDFDRGMVVLKDPASGRLVYHAGSGYQANHQKILVKELLDLPLEKAPHPFAALLNEQTPIMINDIHDYHGLRAHNAVMLFRRLQAGAFLCCPIISDEEVIGVLAVDVKPGGRPLVQSDLNLLQGIAPMIGVSLHNAELLRSRSEQFQSVLQVLAASIDARDFLTSGHSEMVTEYAMGICRELGFDEEYTEMVRIAAMLHDYGKLAVPDFILKKDGPLSPEEKALIRTHAAKSREILERIPFEGLLRQIPEIVGAHHEKLDGSGYPRGLKGEEIPLGARIIAVADFFEAITAKRHYREPMPYPEALQLLAEESLIHFDKTVVDAFFRYFSKGKLCLVGHNDHSVPANAPTRRPRIPYRTQVSCQIDNHTIAGTATNLSVGGLYIAAENELHEGSEAEIIFALPDAPDKLVRARGRVAWINRGNAPKVASLPTGFGLEFIAIEEETSRAVQNFVSRVVLRDQAIQHATSLH